MSRHRTNEIRAKDLKVRGSYRLASFDIDQMDASEYNKEIASRLMSRYHILKKKNQWTGQGTDLEFEALDGTLFSHMFPDGENQIFLEKRHVSNSLSKLKRGTVTVKTRRRRATPASSLRIP